MIEGAGEPCAVCGTSDPLRYKDGRCSVCGRARAAAWRAANPTKVKADSQRWRAANREAHAEAGAKWNMEHPERCAELNALWRAANRERKAASNAAWRERHPDYQRARRAANRAHVAERDAAWRAKNLEQRRATQRRAQSRRRARLAGVPFGFYEEGAIFERDGWICHLCDQAIDPALPRRDPMGATIDHVVPINAGGADIAENVRAAHFRCNMVRHDRPVEWARARLMVA